MTRLALDSTQLAVGDGPARPLRPIPQALGESSRNIASPSRTWNLILLTAAEAGADDPRARSISALGSDVITHPQF